MPEVLAPPKGHRKTLFDWERGFDSQALLSHIAKARTVKERSVSFDAVEHEYWVPVLCSSIKVSSRVGPLKIPSIRAALNRPDTDLANSDAFLSACGLSFEALMSAPQKKYFVLCNVTYTGFRLFDRLTDGDCTLIWQPSKHTKRYRRAVSVRKGLSDLRNAHNVSDTHDNLTDIIIDVRAGTPQEAYEKAIDSLDRFRAIINLLANGGRGLNPFASFSGPRHAVNRFRRGPYQTVHNADGSLAAEMIWYEPRWFHAAKTIKFGGPEAKSRENIRKWWRRAKSGPLAEHLGKGLLRYCHALDNHDTDATLLRLWGVLELVTGTTNAKYDQTVARITRMFSDSDEARLVANHIRIQRNETVHAASSPDNRLIDAIIFQAETLSRRALKFCLFEGRRFKDTQEMYNFLDYSIDLTALDRHRKLMAEFSEYRTALQNAERPPSRSTIVLSKA
jgi:hypothetical protein